MNDMQRTPKARVKAGEPHTHTLREQNKLINRVHRLRGQVDAVERALAANASCSDIIQRVTAARGAIDGLMAELLEEHVREYLLPENADGRRRAPARRRRTHRHHPFLSDVKWRRFDVRRAGVSFPRPEASPSSPSDAR
jgi:DNA-binding FrmR family transcriptional regulator